MMYNCIYLADERDERLAHHERTPQKCIKRNKFHKEQMTLDLPLRNPEDVQRTNEKIKTDSDYVSRMVCSTVQIGNM